MFFNSSVLCKHLKNHRNGIAVLFHNSLDALRQHTGNIFVETAACNMTAPLNVHPCFLHGPQCLHINLSGFNQGFSKGFAQTFKMGMHIFLFHGKYLAHQRKSVAVHAGGCHAHQHVSRLYFGSCNQIFLIHNTHGKACQIIFIHGIKARHLCRLTADERCP